MKRYEAQQKNRAGRLPGIWTIIPVLLAALLVFGCGSDPVSTLGESDVQNVSLTPGWLDDNDGKRCWDASGWVSVASGGSIDLGLYGRGGTFEVEPGAINQDALVEISVCRDLHPLGGEYEFIEFEFLPEHAEFAPAATLTIKARALRRLNGRRGGMRHITLYYFNESSGEWEVAAKAEVRRGQVQFKLDHFSKYGISS